MEINVEKTAPCLVKVSIVVEPDRVDEEFEKTYRQTAEAVAFPGFRKGKAPKKLVLKRFGKIINDDVKEKLLSAALSETVEKHNLEPVSDPDIDLSTIELNEGESMELSFEMETKPVFDLGEYKGLEVELDPLVVLDNEIDEGIRGLQSRFAYLKSIEDQPVDKQHYLTADVTYRIEEEELIREGCQVNMSLGILDGIELGNELERLIGKKVEEVAEIEIANLPAHFMPEKYRGKPARIQVTVKDIREVAFPEVDDEFLNKIEMESMDALRDKISSEIIEKKKIERIQEIERKCMDKLIENHPFDIPEKLLTRQIASQEQNMQYELLRMGVPPEKIAEETGKLDDKNREAAERNIRSNFIYDKIAEKEKIYVTENEIEAELKVIAGQQNTNYQEIKRHYEEQNLTEGLRTFLRNQKIRKLLRENAKAEESEVESSSVEEAETEGNAGGETAV